MISRLFLFGILLVTIPVLLNSQTWKDVPVYPHATLDTTHEPGEEAVCCSFSTTDPLEKVIAFYEAALKTKVLDIPALVAKYPAMKAALQQIKQQLPPDARYVAFVVNEVGYSGAPGPQLFEVLSGRGRTSFNLSDQDLGFSGARLVHEFHKATGTMDNLDQSYEGWYMSHPLAKQEQFEFPVYPGSLIEGMSVGRDSIMDNMNFNLQGKKCYDVDLCILDTLAFEKVVAFYKDKLKGQFKVVPADVSGTSYEMEDKKFYWQEGTGEMDEFHGKQGDVNRTFRIEFAQTIIPQYPYFDREQKTRVAVGSHLRYIIVHFRSVMLGTCEEFPKETRRHRLQEGL